MERFKTFNEFEYQSKKDTSIDKILKESLMPSDKPYSHTNILKFDDYVGHSLTHLETRQEFLEGKKVEHMIDKLDDDEVEEELPVANSYSDAEVGSILTKDLIDDDEMFEIMKSDGKPKISNIEQIEFTAEQISKLEPD